MSLHSSLLLIIQETAKAASKAADLSRDLLVHGAPISLLVHALEERILCCRPLIHLIVFMLMCAPGPLLYTPDTSSHEEKRMAHSTVEFTVMPCSSMKQ